MTDEKSICAKCKHCDDHQDNYEIWQCAISPYKQMNYITGENETKIHFCASKNMTGDCNDFEEASDEEK